jgi:hypothetical protein
LPVATSLNPSDLFLVRQDLLDKQITALILLQGTMQGANNLSDVSSIVTARSNLNVPAADTVLLKANNLSDLSDISASRNNLGLAIGSNVEAWSAQLDALSANNAATGLICQTGTNIVASRSLIQPSSGLTIGNNNGVGGNPTFALANDLAALEGLTGTGFAVRTATDTWVQRQLAIGSSKLSLTFADGVSGNPTLDILEANLNINNMTGSLNISRGGTGKSNKQDAFDALSPLSAGGDLIYFDGTHNQRLPASTQNYVLQTQGLSLPPVWTPPAQVGGLVYLGTFVGVGNTLVINNIHTLVKNCGARVANLKIKVAGVVIDLNTTIKMQLGFALISQLPMGATVTPTYLPPGNGTPNQGYYMWQGSYDRVAVGGGNSHGNANAYAFTDVGIDLCAGLTMQGWNEVSSGPVPYTLWGGEYTISKGGYNGTSFSIPDAINVSGTFFGVMNSGAANSFFHVEGKSWGSGSMNYAGLSQNLISIKIIFAGAGSVGANSPSPNDPTGYAGDCSMSGGTVLLYGETF